MVEKKEKRAVPFRFAGIGKNARFVFNDLTLTEEGRPGLREELSKD